MQLTININDSVADKVLYLLESLHSDVQIIAKEPTPSSLEIETVQENDPDYETLQQARKERAKSDDAYLSMDEVNWESAESLK